MERYLMAKHLFRLTEDPHTQKETFEQLGLYDDPELHLRLEMVYQKWIIQEQKKQKKQ